MFIYSESKFPVGITDAEIEGTKMQIYEGSAMKRISPREVCCCTQGAGKCV